MLRSRRVGGSMHATEKKTERFFGGRKAAGRIESVAANHDCDVVAQTLRNVREISSQKLSADGRVPGIHELFSHPRAERFSFQLTAHPPAGIQPRSDRTFSLRKLITWPRRGAVA